MENMGLTPDDAAYNHVMTAFAKNKDLDMVEKLNQEAIDKYGILPSSQRYNAIILALAKQGKAQEAELVLREMKKQGLKPDIVTYTTVIDAYKRVRNIDKCWQLYDDYAEIEMDGREPDEFMMGYMIRLCAATHDSEKAIFMFN
jgi:pentatricopeptide repeat protein